MRWLPFVLVAAIGPVAAAEDLTSQPCVGSTEIDGVVRDRRTGELLAGATVVATLGDHVETQTTDETGTFAFPVAPGSYQVAVYFAESTWDQLVVVELGQRVALIARVDSADHIIGCYFGPPPVLAVAVPHFGLDVVRGDAPIARDRTHRAWIAPVASADPDRAVTTIGGARRLAGGLGVPLAFVENVETRTLRAPSHEAMGSGGAGEISLLAGSNQASADVRGYVGADATGGGEAVARGAIVHDQAWWAGGLVVHRDRAGQIDAADALVRLDVAATPDHQLAVAGLGQTRTDGSRDDWADAAWTSKLDDNHVEVRAGASAERVAEPAIAAARAIDPVRDLDRIAGRASVLDRVRVAGYHRLELGAEIGGGHAGDARHADAVAYAGDEWDVESNVRVEAGVRGELRRLGDARAVVTAPRAALEWDPTKEGRAAIFVAYQRVPHLDDGAIGAWRTGPRWHDEVAGGVTYEPEHHDWIVGSIASRVRWVDRAARAGAEAWVRIRGDKLSLHAGAASLDRTATIMARRTFGSRDEAFAALIGARISDLHRESAAGVAWNHRGHDTARFDATLEGFAGDLGPGARVVLGASF